MTTRAELLSREQLLAFARKIFMYWPHEGTPTLEDIMEAAEMCGLVKKLKRGCGHRNDDCWCAQADFDPGYCLRPVKELLEDPYDNPR